MRVGRALTRDEIPAPNQNSPLPFREGGSGGLEPALSLPKGPSPLLVAALAEVLADLVAAPVALAGLVLGLDQLLDPLERDLGLELGGLVLGDLVVLRGLIDR